MKDLLKTIWKILQYVDKLFTFFRNAFLNTMLLCLLIFILFKVFLSDEESNKPAIANNSILQVAIIGDIVEQRPIIDPVEKIVNTINETPEMVTYLQDVLDAVYSAADSEKISLIMVDTSAMGEASLDQIRSIGQALKHFRSKGKKVVASADSYSQRGYLLASFADTVLLNPMGSVQIFGLGKYSLYFREALEKLKINSHVFRVGSYKSAVEPFLRDSMSEEDRKQSAIWLNGLWHEYCADIESNRKLKPESLQSFLVEIEGYLAAVHGDSAMMAKNQGFVDKLCTRKEVDDYLRTLIKLDVEKDLPFISIKEYLAASNTKHSYEQGGGNIAVIVAEGIILDGRHVDGNIGGDTVAEQIETARKDDNIKALVLRINSGGGSAFASEIIRQELLAFKKSGKKIVVSMGSMAASGGYWISADADEIWAAPTTITGSIGVFGTIPTFENSLQSIGVHSDGVGTTPLSGGMPPMQKFNPVLKNLIQQGVEHTYGRFISLVAKGRKLETRYVANIAEGRVYDGRTALQKKLVDKMGNLPDAIKSAAKLAGISKPDPQYIRPKLTVKEQIFSLFGSVRVGLLRLVAGDEIAEVVSFLRQNRAEVMLPLYDDPKHIYAYTPQVFLQ